MSPFMLTGVEIKDLEGQLGGQHSSNKKPSHGLDFFRMQFDPRMLKYINGITGEDSYRTNITLGESICSEQVGISTEETSTSQTGGGLETLLNMNLQPSSPVCLKFRFFSQHELLKSDSSLQLAWFTLEPL